MLERQRTFAGRGDCGRVELRKHDVTSRWSAEVVYMSDLEGTTCASNVEDMPTGKMGGTNCVFGIMTVSMVTCDILMT